MRYIYVNILRDRLPICVKLHILVVKFGGDKCIASFSSSDILSISWIYRTIQKKHHRIEAIELQIYLW
ncbi:unnamed protein product [Rhizophagus irregularis]|nr:unnamed protein product [Rhizophagus irregularis]